MPVSSRPAFWPATSPAIQDGQSRPSQPIASRTMAELARLAGRSDH
ncbi:EspF repeat-containing protein [Aeromonas sp. sif2433]